MLNFPITFLLKTRSILASYSLLLIFLLTSITPVLAQSSVKRSEQIKVAFIYNIARYVTWNNHNDQSIKLCFLEKNPFNSAIKSIENKFIGNKKIVVQTIPLLHDHYNCQILFLTQQQIDRIALDLQENEETDDEEHYSLLEDEDLLIMGDMSDNTMATAKLNAIIISLVRYGNRLGLSVNRQSLSNSRLKLSSQLLKLSKSN